MGSLKTLRRLAGCAAAGVLVLASACAANLPPIQVDGTSRDLDRLVGQWTGEYQSDEDQGRTGSIAFILGAEERVAKGDVLTSPRNVAMRFEGRDPEWVATGRTLGSASQSLTIHFVRAEDQRLYGELDPYWDPDLQCEAVTRFEGVRAGNTIRGTYETTFPSLRIKKTGRWTVTRLQDDSARRR
jgi:hypothetical protein